MQSLLNQIKQLTTQLTAGVKVVNLCRNRGNFIAGLLAAAQQDGQIIFPNDQSINSLYTIHQNHSIIVLIDDKNLHQTLGSDPTLEVIFLDPVLSNKAFLLTQDLMQSTCNILQKGSVKHYTSGSTGHPSSWTKSLKSMMVGTQKTFSRLQEIGNLHTNHCIIATVPPQHMYGFENSILLPLLHGLPAFCGQPFYPQDIADSCQDSRDKVCLITTPFHLRTLLDSGVKINNIALIVSATAPLPQALAKRVEDQYACPVLEIYGTTETGVIATRRTARDRYFQPLENIILTSQNDDNFYRSDHVDETIKLDDFLNIESDASFEIIGRNSDMVKVAGKRTSLTILNEILLSIDGVEDGVFFIPDAVTSTDIQRPVIFLKAGNISKDQLRRKLAHSIDPVFVPRIIIELDLLPRNETGKIQRSELVNLWQHYRRGRTTWKNNNS